MYDVEITGEKKKFLILYKRLASEEKSGIMKNRKAVSSRK